MLAKMKTDPPKMKTDPRDRGWLHYWVLSFPIGVPVWEIRNLNQSETRDMSPRGIFRAILHTIIFAFILMLMVNLFTHDARAQSDGDRVRAIAAACQGIGGTNVSAYYSCSLELEQYADTACERRELGFMSAGIAVMAVAASYGNPWAFVGGAALFMRAYYAYRADDC